MTTKLEVEMTDREKEAVQAVLSELKAIWKFISPVISSLAADQQRRENWEIAGKVAERVKADAQ